MSKQQLVDKTYLDRYNTVQLFLQLGQDSLSVAHFDASNNQYVGLEYYRLESQENWSLSIPKIESVLQGLDLKKYQKAVRVALVDPLYTFIPKALFDSEEVETYIKFNHPIDDSEHLDFQFDLIEDLQLVVVYALPKELKTLLEKDTTQLKWNHFSKPLLEAASLKSSKDQLFQVHVQNKRFDALLVKEGKLQYFNSFPYETVEDFVYYLLYAMEQLKLDREADKIELVGEFEEHSALYELLFKYIRNLSIGGRPNAVNFSTILSSLPAHYHYNLFNQHLCE